MASVRSRPVFAASRLLVVLAVTGALGGCLGGSGSSSSTTSSTSVAPVGSDGTSSSSSPPSSSYSVPSVSGTPPTAVFAGSPYTFQIAASDADGDVLRYSASNLPSWLGVNSSNGVLSGTPAVEQVGVYFDIVISVTDGRTTVSLPSFSLTVLAAQVEETGGSGWRERFGGFRPACSDSRARADAGCDCERADACTRARADACPRTGSCSQP